MTIDMYSDKVAETSALIREFAKVDYFHYFARDPESSLEEFIAMLDQAEEKGRQSQAARIAELGRQLEEAEDLIAQTSHGAAARISATRAEVLEEAALAVENLGDTNPPMSYGIRCAEVIRALASAPAVEQQPVAYMFDVHIKRLGQRRQFAAIDYNLDSDETLVAKSPLYSAPQAADTDKVREAVEAMNRAKLLPIWDNDVPHKLHVELDVIFKALSSMAAQAPVREVPGWQPIETAPKDGTRILVWLGSPWSNVQAVRVQAVRWFESWQNWQTEDFPDEHDEYCGIGSELPTHWMPLPSPPEADK